MGRVPQDMPEVDNSFRGNWFLPWVATRYEGTFFRALNLSKLANASCALTEMALAQPKVWSRPFVLRLEPTSVCNLRCTRCSTGLGRDPRPKGFLDLADLDILIEQVRDHVVFVRLDGAGEPLLHPEINECIRRIRKAGMAVTLSSHLNTPPTGGFDELVGSGLDRLVVAVDGACQETYEKYRVGGNLDRVIEHLEQICVARDRQKYRMIMDIQFLDWGYNHHEIPEIQKLAQKFCADKVTVISPDWAVTGAHANPNRSRRCFWLWCVVTVDWRLHYRSCTNAWTYPFPNANAHDTPVHQMWNCEAMAEARRFNRNKCSALISTDAKCLCNHCTDMLVVDRPPGYVCE